jgi:RNA polymerase sigma-70 factor (ECF subfamily)
MARTDVQLMLDVWMFRIATNLALNSVRDNRHRRMEISMDQPADSGEEDARPLEVPDRAPSVEQELVARSRAAMILRAIHSLPEKQRAAVLLHKYQELDYDEIARVLECSESALKSLLFRAYETLRVELAPLVSPTVRVERVPVQRSQQPV